MSSEELRNLVSQLQMDLMETARQKEEGQGQIHRLQHKLEATENTVRHISRKLKSSRPSTPIALEQTFNSQQPPIPTPPQRHSSESETPTSSSTTVHRGDHWSRIYHGMLNGQHGCSGRDQGSWQGGGGLLRRSSDWNQHSCGNYNADNAKNQILTPRAKSLTSLDKTATSNANQQTSQTMSSSKLQRVKKLSSSCILSSPAKHSNEMPPVALKKRDNETVYNIDNIINEQGNGEDRDHPFFVGDSKPETEILNKLQRLLLEKEDMWRMKTTEIKHKMKKENFLLMQENELLQEEVKLLKENVNSHERKINEMKRINEVKVEEQKKIEDEIEKLKQEKIEMTEDLSNQNKELADLDKTLCRMEITKKESYIQKRKNIDDLEENKKELDNLRKELQRYKEVNKSLKDNLIKKEASLQEQIFTVRKLKAEKTKDTKQTINRTPDLIKTDAGFQRSNSSLNENYSQSHINGIYGQAKTSYNQEHQYELVKQTSDLKEEIKRLKDETLKVLSDKERDKVNFYFQVADMEKHLADKGDLENRLAQAEFELKSKKGLDEELAVLRSQLEKKHRHEMKMRSRVVESEAAVSRERAELLATRRELNEKADKVKKRDKQCQELCEKFGKLDAAYTKQTKLLLGQTETIDFLKKRLQFYEEGYHRKHSNKHIEDRTIGSKL